MESAVLSPIFASYLSGIFVVFAGHAVMEANSTDWLMQGLLRTLAQRKHNTECLAIFSGT